MLQTVETAQTPPEPGELKQIAPGIGWIRMPLPFRLNHVNCWVLDDGPSWTVIDCGVDTPAIRDIWTGLKAGPLAAKPIGRLITTHGHTDHVGCAGFFVDTFGCSYETTLIEYLTANLRRAEMQKGDFSDIKRFLASHGCGDEILGSFDADRSKSFSYLGKQPPSFLRLSHDGRLRIGGRQWRIIVGSGHAEEHMSLFSESDGILIAGDQILPKITPMVGVFSAEPLADPLGAYIGSLDRFAGLPADTFVLPSHGEPFSGIRSRLDYLANHHKARLEKIEEILDRPVTASDVSTHLFARAIGEGQGRLALAETLAHLNHLVALGRTKCRLRDGVYFYEKA